MESIFEAVVTKGMAGLAAAAIGIMLFLGKVPVNGKKLNSTKFWKDWGIFLLLGICTIGAFAPGVNDIPVNQWGSIMVFAMVSSVVAMVGRKLLKPIIFNKLEGKTKGD
jgi:hypothetical protein